MRADLKVAKVLLSQPRLGGDLHRLAVEGAQDGEERLARAQVRRHEEAHALVAHQLPNLQARHQPLRKPALRESNLRVRLGRVDYAVDVALGLAVAHQDDAFWPLRARIEASLTSCCRAVPQHAHLRCHGPFPP